jgi:hypothetical protein
MFHDDLYLQDDKHAVKTDGVLRHWPSFLNVSASLIQHPRAPKEHNARLGR